MKHFFLIIFTLMASLAILPSCSDSEPEEVPGFPIPDNYHHGVLMYDSVVESVVLDIIFDNCSDDYKNNWLTDSNRYKAVRIIPTQIQITPDKHISLDSDTISRLISDNCRLVFNTAGMDPSFHIGNVVYYRNDVMLAWPLVPNIDFQDNYCATAQNYYIQPLFSRSTAFENEEIYDKNIKLYLHILQAKKWQLST